VLFRSHTAVGPLHAPVSAHSDYGILHGVEQGLELVLTGLHSGEGLFHLAGCFVESAGDLANLVHRDRRDSCGEISLCHTVSKFHDPLQPPRRVMGRDGRRHRDNDEDDQRALPQGAVDALRSGFQVGERIREPYCAA